MRLEIRAERSAYACKVTLYMLDRDGRAVVRNLEFQPYTDGEYLISPVELGDSEAQLLMDELWRCGLRPSEGTGSAGSLAATERHLADMRRLVFDEPRGGER